MFDELCAAQLTVVERLIACALVECLLGFDFDETIALARAVARSAERRAVA